MVDAKLEAAAARKPLAVCVKEQKGLQVGIPPKLREYRDPIFDLAKDPEVVVEIGTLQGWFAWRLGKFLPDAQIFSVDVFESSKEYGSGPYNKNCWFKNTDGMENVRLIVGDSREEGEKYRLSMVDSILDVMPLIDWLFIDGDHSYEGFLADLEAWYPHVRRGGLVSGHDVDGKYGPNIQRALDEFCPRNGIPEIRVDDLYSFTGVQVTPCWYFYK